MQVVVKVGSMLNIPVGNTGFTASSSDASVIAVSNAGTSVALTAMKAGMTVLTLKLANDLSVSLSVKVA